MNRNYLCAVALAAAAGLSGCDRPADEHNHAELEQIQLEIEQLTNQVGRLEFRIFELESQQSGPTSDAGAAAKSQQNANTISQAEPLETAELKTDNGRYDLTPVQ